jgi:hypothetical protein
MWLMLRRCDGEDGDGSHDVTRNYDVAIPAIWQQRLAVIGHDNYIDFLQGTRSIASIILVLAFTIKERKFLLF